jgi:hypothetical protein
MAYVSAEGYTFPSAEQLRAYEGGLGPISSTTEQAWINSWGTASDPMLTSNNFLGLRSRENIMAPVPETLPTLRPKDTSYEPSAWSDHVSRASWANAGITLALSGITSLFNAFSSNKIYNMYAEQEKYMIENAAEQARRLQIKGDIALANLKAKHAITEGTNELAIAGAGAGSISGSFLDKLMANRKYDTREEFTQSLDTLYAVDNAKRDGFIQAYNVAGQAMQHAYKQRGEYLSNFVKGLALATSDIVSDIKQGYNNEVSRYGISQKYETERSLNALKYSVPEVIGPSAEEGVSSVLIDTGYSPESLSDSLKIESNIKWGTYPGSTELSTYDYDLIKPTKKGVR